jgi:polar amino acid transport system ATP-binding protein
VAEHIPVLKVQNLKKRFGNQDVLRGVSFELFRGDIKVIIGPSGGGKSTLLHCINFLVKLDEGRIHLNGKEVNYAKKRELNAYRQKVGMIFQDFNLFDHLDALHNVQIGLIRVKGISKAEAEVRAVSELERVGLKDHLYKYPAELSGGQKQRVSIARALAMDPEVMLLDEPTSALDPELIGEVNEAIRNLASGGMTMLLVTHELGFAGSLANEIFFVEDGKILEKGPPQQILNHAAFDRTRRFCNKICRPQNGS